MRDCSAAEGTGRVTANCPEPLHWETVRVKVDLLAASPFLSLAEPDYAGDIMGKEFDGGVLWQVVSTRDRERRRMERHLKSGGFLVAREGLLPLEVRLSTVRAAVEITEAERAVLGAMLVCDGAQEIAEYLHISRHTVYDQTKALMHRFGVHSRYRVIVQALRSGVLELTSADRSGRQTHRSEDGDTPILGDLCSDGQQLAGKRDAKGPDVI
jgi:DNA-binding CsgD family transcriptional regulator